MGRSGVLCLLIVGCRGATYVFDVHKLGAECFSKGLRSFLENTYLLKVSSFGNCAVKSHNCLETCCCSVTNLIN